MAHSVLIADKTFSKFSAQSPPFNNLAQMLLYFGETNSLSAVNQLNGLGNASIVGAPATFPGQKYSTLGPVDGFEGPMAASGSPFTHVLIAMLVSGGMYCGNWNSGTSKAANALFSNSSSLYLAIDGSAPMAGLSFTPSVTDFDFIAGTHETTGNLASVYRGSGAGTSLVKSVQTKAPPASAQHAAFRAGGNGFGGGTFKSAMVMTFDVALSEAQLLSLYQFLVPFMADRGITVR